jgi:cell division protein ftsX
MKSFKTHLSVIIPLVALLVGIQFILLVGRVVDEYESVMNKDYSIIIVSQNELNATDVKPLVYTFESLEPLSSKPVLEKLSKDISSKNIAVLQNALPKFYSLKLNAFPSAQYMQEIKDKISKINGVSRVETFSKTHDKIYKIMQLIKNISAIFSGLIGLIGLMLIAKQMRIWLYEHKERIEIMTLLGAPSWLKSGALYKTALFDSFIATVLVAVFYIILPDLQPVKEVATDLNINLPAIDLFYEGGVLLGVSLAISFFAVYLVMRKARAI